MTKKPLFYKKSQWEQNVKWHCLQRSLCNYFDKLFVCYINALICKARIYICLLLLPCALFLTCYVMDCFGTGSSRREGSSRLFRTKRRSGGPRTSRWTWASRCSGKNIVFFCCINPGQMLLRIHWRVFGFAIFNLAYFHNLEHFFLFMVLTWFIIFKMLVSYFYHV